MDGLFPDPESLVNCDTCGTHFSLTPGQSTDGMACPECGGSRFFRNQPSPTQSDGALRDMVDPISQRDQGGNPDGEGTIMNGGSASKASQPFGKRDDSFPGTGTYGAMDPNEQYNPQGEQSRIERLQQIYQRTEDPSAAQEILKQIKQLQAQEAMNPQPEDPELHSLFQGLQDPAMEFDGYPAQWNRQGSVTKGVVRRHLDMEPYDALFHEGETKTALGPPLGYAQERQKALGLPSPGDPGAAASLAEMGGIAALPLAIPAAAEALGVGAGAAAGAGAAEAAEAGGASAVAGGAASVGKNLLGKGVGQLMKGVMGQGAGGQQAAPSLPFSPPGQVLTGSTIPMLLVSDFETALSTPSVGEQDNPDPHQFHDGDKSPSNFHNPNLEDSGMNGEDATAGDSGFAPGSPGLERIQMSMPLLHHYYHSEESGERDPMVRALHETLERERPGYLNDKDEDGSGLQGLFGLQQQPMGVHAGVNMMPGGGMTPAPVPAVPSPMGVPGGQGAGTCPQCGGVMGADGSCPQCGAGQQQPATAMDPNQLPGQGGSPTPGGGMGGTSMPPPIAHVARALTPDLQAALVMLLQQEGRDQEISDAILHPENYPQELAKIQQQPNVAPQPDPSQVQQTPPPAMEAPQGAMPSPDPSQPGPGGQPMQPMARTADANNGTHRCPNCGSASTRMEGLGDNSQDGTTGYGHCPSCGTDFDVLKKTHVYSDLVDMPNHQPDHKVWADNSGQDLVPGQSYELHSPAFSVPSSVKVLDVAPGKLELQLEDGIGIHTGRPDITVSRQEAQLENYSFVPVQADADTRQSTDPDTMPGQSPDQVPPIETTDTHQDDVNPHTVTHVDNSRCRKCSSEDVDHSLSSPDVSLHQCYRCSYAWETQEEDHGRTSAIDLSWIHEDNDPLEPSAREQEMMRASSGSRNLADVAAKDSTYQAIKSRLNANKISGKLFSQSERRELIDEYGVARNLDNLDLANTHYDIQYDHTGKADDSKVRDSDLFMGL